MEDIGTMRARVEEALELAETLVAAKDAFGLLLEMTEQCEERRDELFAAYAFASAAAAEARHIIAGAPSLPPARAMPASHPAPVTADRDTTAALAGLARMLTMCLSAAALQAGDARDQAACRDAATEASRIYELLARDS
jgi:hypothetical protein